MGIIAIEGIEIFAYHGVYPVEREAGNRFFVDLYLEADLEKAAKSDALSDTVDYHAVYKVVLEHMEEPANLLETLAYRIGPDILARFQQIEAATVRVRKLSPHAMAHCRETYVEQKFHQKEDKTEKSGN
ncbi:MAG: dihydroneopterin aldolase [Bacteroidia bacterium]|jgi:7,8-dihydroneopterin aldolase/epimerase/oxygenase|nr:dihydroneopterin aldolase [Bacteroidia bacterium]